jgi:co-chaperonin GroES (HSP10)
MDFFTIKKAPFQPLLWKVLVQIPLPPEKIGSIVMVDDTREAAEFASYVGYVSAVGQFAFTAVTKAGIDLNELERKPMRGDWVIFNKHAGSRFRTSDDTLWILMADTEIDGIVEDPSIFECMKL